MEKSKAKRTAAIALWLALGVVLLFFAALSAYFLGEAIVELVRMLTLREAYVTSSWSVDLAVTLLVALAVSFLVAAGGDVLIAFKLAALFKNKEQDGECASKPDKKQLLGGAALILLSCAALVALVACVYGISSGSVSLSHRFEGAPWVSRVIAETVVSSVFLVVAGAGIVLCALWWKGVFKPRKEQQGGLQALTRAQKTDLALYGLLIAFFVFLLAFVLWLFA